MNPFDGQSIMTGENSGIPELYQQLELLKEEIKKRDATIDELESHVLSLETEPLSSKRNEDYPMMNLKSSSVILRMTRYFDYRKKMND